MGHVYLLSIKNPDLNELEPIFVSLIGGHEGKNTLSGTLSFLVPVFCIV